MNIVIFGPQGCGKGTQADKITEKYGYYHLSMGDELRKEVKKSTSLGKKIEKMINSGVLVPDEITNQLLLNVSKTKQAKSGIIFDGYPRRQGQLDFLIEHFDIDCALEIDLSEKESINRIASRRVCPKCGKNYNLIWLKPRVSGKCDICRETLKQRDDDKPAEIKKRLKIYNKDTLPLKKYYQSKSILYTIDGTKSILQVFSQIDSVLKKIK